MGREMFTVKPVFCVINASLGLWSGAWTVWACPFYPTDKKTWSSHVGDPFQLAHEDNCRTRREQKVGILTCLRKRDFLTFRALPQILIVCELESFLAPKEQTVWRKYVILDSMLSVCYRKQTKITPNFGQTRLLYCHGTLRSKKAREQLFQ